MMASDSTHSISIASINLILFAARQRGADAGELAKTVGIETALLADPDARIPIRQVQHLWHELIRVTHDPAMPLKIGEYINPMAIGPLMYVMMHCPTLGQALAKLCHYQDIACEGVRTTGRCTPPGGMPSDGVGGVYELVLELTSPAIIYPDYVFDSELSVYMAAIRALTGQAITSLEVRLAYPRPADTREHERVFGPARLVFGATETALVFDARVLETPILNASTSLFTLFSQHADAVLTSLQAPTLSTRVKREITDLLKGEEPALATVADRLALGVRTLQLHLKAEGTTYRQLLDDIRKTLAINHMRASHLSTTDIAYLLGFTEPSVFFRSFRKWTGETPGTFRRRALAATQPV